MLSFRRQHDLPRTSHLSADQTCALYVHNPLRVLRNDDGSEIVFTLYRLPSTSDEDFERDAALVREALARLRDILEAGGS